MTTQPAAGWKHLAVILCLLALPGLCCAQGFAVAGRVTDSLTGSPLARATVSLEPVQEQDLGPQAPGQAAPPAADATTGPDGGFRFTGLGAGKYRLSAARRGYLTANFEEHGNFFAAIVVGPQAPQATGLRFAMLPLASIIGSVLDSSGDPVEQGLITLFMHGFDGTGAVRMVRSTSLRPGDTTYEFDSLAPGAYFVAVSARPWYAQTQGAESQNGPLDLAYPSTFYENSTSSAAAEPIELKAGDAAQANFSLQPVHAVHLQMPMNNGINMALSAPAFGGALQASAGSFFFRNGHDGAPATMDMAVAPGTYLLDLDPGKAVDVTGNRTLPASQPNAGVALTGKLAMVDGSALPAGTGLRLSPLNGSFSSYARSAAMRRSGGTGAFSVPGARGMDPVMAAADGSFHAEEVVPGEYQLGLNPGAGENLRITAAAASGGTVTDKLTLKVGSDPVILAATIARANSTVTGRVIDAHGAPASGVMVLIVPQDPKAVTLYGQDESDSDGTWVIRNLTPGSYRAVAIQDGWDLAWKQPEVLARYMAAGSTAVTLSADKTTALTNDLPAQPRR